MSFFEKIEKSWTLFLDRDGVINRRPINDYVKTWDDFEFLPGVLESLKILNDVFGRIVIITNQQGVGKGLMSEEALLSIHKNMIHAIEDLGGRIDKIYFCPDLADKKNNCRKPGPVMAIQAKTDFPEIDFKKSIMVGDTASDMKFGRNMNMFSVLIRTENDIVDKSDYNAEFSSLLSFANRLSAND